VKFIKTIILAVDRRSRIIYGPVIISDVFLTILIYLNLKTLNRHYFLNLVIFHKSITFYLPKDYTPLFLYYPQNKPFSLV